MNTATQGAEKSAKSAATSAAESMDTSTKAQGQAKGAAEASESSAKDASDKMADSVKLKKMMDKTAQGAKAGLLGAEQGKATANSGVNPGAATSIINSAMGDKNALGFAQVKAVE